MNRTPKVAAVQDLSGLGRCSLSVILPVLSVMGTQCCPLPTAVLSAHTAFPAPEAAAFQDLTGAMEQTLDHWEALHVTFDAIYSGFLGSLQQIALLRRLIQQFRQKETLVLIDPVMGDHGRVYRTYTQEMCEQTALLAAEADLITPNLTEAALLLGEPFDRIPTTQAGIEAWLQRLSCEQTALLAAEADLITPNLTEAALLLGEPFDRIPTTQAGIEAWLQRLSLDGKRSVVITGVSLAPKTLGAGCLDGASGKIRFAMARQEPGQFFGTGDLFAAVLLGSLLRGEALSEATARAVDFIQKAVARTLAAGTPMLEGVQFEPLLQELV